MFDPLEQTQNLTTTVSVSVGEMKKILQNFEQFLALQKIKTQGEDFAKKAGLAKTNFFHALHFAEMALAAFDEKEVFEIPETRSAEEENSTPSVLDPKEIWEELRNENFSLEVSEEAGVTNLLEWIKKDSEKREKAVSLMISLISYHSDLRNLLLHFENDLDAALASLNPKTKENLTQQFGTLVQHTADLDMLLKEFNLHFNQSIGSQEYVSGKLLAFLSQEKKEEEKTEFSET